MSEPKDLPALSREELLALVVELQRQIAEVRASNEALRAEIDQLSGHLWPALERDPSLR